MKRKSERKAKMSNDTDQITDKTLKMIKANGSAGSVNSTKTIDVKEWEVDKNGSTQTDGIKQDKCCRLDPVDWSDDDPRWGNPPTIGSPTVVKAEFMIGQLQDLDTVRGTIYVQVGVWCYWKDHRLAGRSRMDPLPHRLWSPRLTVAESLGDFERRTSEFALTIGTVDGNLSTFTWYEGTIKNPMDLRLFPLDVDTLHITFFASECYRLNGEINVNYKTDYRLLLEGGEPPSVTPYGWDLVSTKILYTFHEHYQDALQIQINFKRCFNYYFFKIVFPLFLITCLSFMGFFLEDGNLGERLANNSTMFLSALALLYVVGQDLPKTTFLTAIDRIVVVSLSLIFGTSIHFVIISHEDSAMTKVLTDNHSSKNITNGTFVSIQNVTNPESQENKYAKHKYDYKLALPYFFGYLAYIILEILILAFMRMKHCREFKTNLNKDGIFLDGIEDHNTRIKENPSYNLPADLIIDPFRLVLMKKSDSRALVLPQLLTKTDDPVQLLLPSSEKAVVMSAKPAFQVYGKDVQWVTLGSSVRALEVVYDINLNIRLASRREQIFTVALSKYDEGNDVVLYADMKGEDEKAADAQKFEVNSNGTISPLKAPELVLGMEATSGT